MSRSIGLSRRRRNVTVAVAALAGGLIFLVAGALADAGNPILTTIKGSAVDNGNGTVTIYVRGQWNWLSHGSDCNFNRAATGAGIIWNDPTEPGYTVSKGAISAGVGISNLRAGDAVNTIDQMVHPVDRGNQVEGYTAPPDYPATQQFGDPSPPGITAAKLAAWKGGCGREPLTATASKGANSERTGLTCANGTLTCADHPWGSWGYEKDNGPGKPFGYSHTYEKIQSSGPNAGQSGLPSRVCVNFYDVHGGGNEGDAKFQVPNGTNEITVDGNGDNSIETNSFDVTNGANCISVVTPTLTTAATNAAVGGSISDAATLSGVPAGAHGTLTFGAYGPNDSTCANAPFFTSQVPVNGSNTYSSGASPAVVAGGQYYWKVSYSGDPGNLVLPVALPCGDTSGANHEVSSVVDATISITPQTAVNEVGHQHTFTITVTALPAGATPVSFGAITTSVAPAPTTQSTTCGAPVVNGNTATCTLTINSSTAGVFTANATAQVTMGGVTVTRSTSGNSGPGGTGPATKRFVDASISISPLTAVNEVGNQHVFTITVTAIPAGATPVSFGAITTSVAPAPTTQSTTCGAPVVNGNTATCTLTINSSSTGVFTANATAQLTIGGQALTRSTAGNSGPGGSGSATKRFVDASISIAPLTAVNEVNHAHVITATVQQNDGLTAAQGGDGVTGFGPAPNGTTVTFSLLNNTAGAAFVGGISTCTTTGGACSVSINTTTAGSVDIHATTTFDVGGVSLTRATGTGGLNSANANKRYADANIQLNPPSAINPVSTNHVLTAHVNVNGGTGFGNAPDGTKISFTIDSGPGSLSTPNPCTTAGGTGSCSIRLTSATPGTTVVSAHVTIDVGGVSLTRHTNGTASNSGPATKLFADDTVRTDILNAADGVVTSVVAGTVVHDKVFVAKTAATPPAVPNPTGNVVFHRYATIDCTGTATNQTVVLTAGSPSTAVSDAFAPTANMSYAADYLGDANYPARSGACEPLTVTPVPAPAIAIVKNPKSQTVAVGGTATFTITVTNAGNTILTDVTVVDPLSPNCNRTKAEIPALASMAPGATVTYTCTRPNVRAGFDNVATATGTPPTGPNVTASDTAPVKAQALTPAKKKIVKKKKPKVVSHKKPKATG